MVAFRHLLRPENLIYTPIRDDKRLRLLIFIWKFLPSPTPSPPRRGKLNQLSSSVNGWHSRQKSVVSHQEEWVRKWAKELSLCSQFLLCLLRSRSGTCRRKEKFCSQTSDRVTRCTPWLDHFLPIDSRIIMYVDRFIWNYLLRRFLIETQDNDLSLWSNPNLVRRALSGNKITRTQTTGARVLRWISIPSEGFRNAFRRAVR